MTSSSQVDDNDGYTAENRKLHVAFHLVRRDSVNGYLTWFNGLNYFTSQPLQDGHWVDHTIQKCIAITDILAGAPGWPL